MLPFLTVLGIAQDGGVPQAGGHWHPAWGDRSLRRHAACLGIADPATNQRWMIECTPDFREQLHHLCAGSLPGGSPLLSGIALTHAHIGHYAGLVHLGREAMGVRGLPLLVMPRMAEFLKRNAPWEMLIQERNVELVVMKPNHATPLNERLSLTPILVPHRDEYSETVAFVIAGPQIRVLFLPDIDRWELLDAWGTRIEELLASVDVAYLDATFFDRNELPGRNMTLVPHPTITESMERFAKLPETERRKIRFIHLNHTNPALDPNTAARQAIAEAGYAVAEEGEVVGNDERSLGY